MSPSSNRYKLDLNSSAVADLLGSGASSDASIKDAIKVEEASKIMHFILNFTALFQHSCLIGNSSTETGFKGQTTININDLKVYFFI